MPLVFEKPKVFRSRLRNFVGKLIPWLHLHIDTIYPYGQPGSPSAPVREFSGLPPSPRVILANRELCEMPILGRRVIPTHDRARDALYRIYEHLVLDQYLQIRNELEAFWYHKDWAVRAIPDPKDPDPERYACLACITRLLVLAFNRRIELGLPRHAPPIITNTMIEEWSKQAKVYEEEPPWVAGVPALPEMLAIPHWDNDKRDFVPLPGFDDKRASRQFSDKNILIWQPHIHFL